MRSRCALLFVLMHIAGFSGAATAQNVDQQLCLAPDPDLSISRCTAMIQSGHETQQNLAVAFSDRGIAYARKGQYDRAIEDLDQAIRLNPNYAAAFNNRGSAYSAKGDLDRAIELTTRPSGSIRKLPVMRGSTGTSALRVSKGRVTQKRL